MARREVRGRMPARRGGMGWLREQVQAMADRMRGRPPRHEPRTPMEGMRQRMERMISGRQRGNHRRPEGMRLVDRFGRIGGERSRRNGAGRRR